MGASTAKRRKGSKNKAKANKPTRPEFTADTADKHVLYQLSVQNVEAEIDFVDAEFERLRGRKAVVLREDFCGTGNTSCEWVRRRESNIALGLDIDEPTLEWGREHNVAPLEPAQRERVTLLNRNVLEPGDAAGVDCVLAMNFSYWLFRQRAELRAYFQSVRQSLGEGGVFFLDHYGGYESMQETTEKRKIDATPEHGPFTYVWEQARYNPINGDMDCRISFHFPDKTKLKHAFSYTWRLWTLPEIREILHEAGFGTVTVYWEGDEVDSDGEETGEGNGEFTPATEGSADPAFICYIAAHD